MTLAQFAMIATALAWRLCDPDGDYYRSDCQLVA